MKKKYLFCLLTLFVSPGITWAGAWSSCQTVTAISNYLAYTNAVFIVFSPGIPGCAANVSGGVTIQVGQLNVTSDNMKTMLATTMFAYGADKRVMVFYDDSNSNCFTQIVSVGGYAGQCP